MTRDRTFSQLSSLNERTYDRLCNLAEDLGVTTEWLAGEMIRDSIDSDRIPHVIEVSEDTELAMKYAELTTSGYSGREIESFANLVVYRSPTLLLRVDHSNERAQLLRRSNAPEAGGTPTVDVERVEDRDRSQQLTPRMRRVLKRLAGHGKIRACSGRDRRTLECLVDRGLANCLPDTAHHRNPHYEITIEGYKRRKVMRE